MSVQADEHGSATASSAGTSALWRTAQIAPWIVFGPITGIMSGLALRCLRNKQPGLAVICLILNVAFVAAIPLATAAVASWR
jgi:hypothetical protein